MVGAFCGCYPQIAKERTNLLNEIATASASWKAESLYSLIASGKE
jgi:hypothetical protein